MSRISLRINFTWGFLPLMSIAVAVLLLGAPAILRAQTESDSLRCPVGAGGLNGGPILKKVQGRYSELSSLKARFTQTSYSPALDLREISSGEVSYSSAGAMRWDYLAPEAQTFSVIGKDIWFYQPRERQLMIDRIEEMVISDLPLAFLGGMGNLVEKFSVAKSCQLGKTIVLELMPLGKDDEALKRFVLVVDGGDFLPRSAEVIDAGGNETRITLSDLRPNVKFASDVFEVKVPAGTDINDRRAANVKEKSIAISSGGEQ